VVQFLGAVTQSSPMMIVTEYLPKVCSSILLFTMGVAFFHSYSFLLFSAGCLLLPQLYYLCIILFAGCYVSFSMPVIVVLFFLSASFLFMIIIS